MNLLKNKPRQLKVLLIQPSYKDCVQSLFTIYNSEEGIGFKPPLGLLYIATAIQSMTIHSVKIIDCQIDDTNYRNILERVVEEYDVFGISAWTDFWFQALSIGKKLKEKYPSSHVVMGGPHVTIFPHEILQFDCVDSIIMGDGEIPMIELLRMLSGESDDDKHIKGLYFRGVSHNSYVPYVCEDLNSLPIPDRSLLPLERYTSVLSPNQFITTMITSRGCPYSCVFCKLKLQKPLRRSAENVIEEFEMISKMGIKEVEVYDDTFNWHNDRTMAICKGLIERKIKLKWSIRDRADKVKGNVLEYLKKAGCYRIHIGIETGSDRVMEMIKKKITVAQARRAVWLAKKNGFVVLTYFMYGLPGETMVEARETLALALALDTDYVEFSIMIPYPGTESYALALQEGIIPFDYWLEFTKNPTQSYQIPYVIENLISRKELIEMRDMSLKKFYFRSRYMLREFLKVRSYGELRRKMKMAIGLLNILKGKMLR